MHLSTQLKILWNAAIFLFILSFMVVNGYDEAGGG